MTLAPWSMNVGYFCDIIFLSCFEIYREQGVIQESNKAQSWCGWKDTDRRRCNLSQTDLPPAVILGTATMFLHPVAAFVKDSQMLYKHGFIHLPSRVSFTGIVYVSFCLKKNN